MKICHLWIKALLNDHRATNVYLSFEYPVHGAFIDVQNANYELFNKASPILIGHAFIRVA